MIHYALPIDEGSEKVRYYPPGNRRVWFNIKPVPENRNVTVKQKFSTGHPTFPQNPTYRLVLKIMLF